MDFVEGVVPGICMPGLESSCCSCPDKLLYGGRGHWQFCCNAQLLLTAVVTVFQLPGPDSDLHHSTLTAFTGIMGTQPGSSRIYQPQAFASHYAGHRLADFQDEETSSILPAA
jgi:hypothetical protein